MKYEQMVSSDRKDIEPALLPPTGRAVHFHGVYHEVKLWRKILGMRIMILPHRDEEGRNIIN